MLDGELLDGASANAGHVGHIIVEPNGRRCGCGARGCLEAEASGLAIEAITGRSPTEPTYEIMQRTGRLVGRAVASLCTLLDLELVVVGGGVALGFAATFFNAANEELTHGARLPYTRHARITPARLGDRGPLIGAGAVGIRGMRRRWRLSGQRADCGHAPTRIGARASPVAGSGVTCRRDQDPQRRSSSRIQDRRGQGGGGRRAQLPRARRWRRRAGHPDEGRRRDPRPHRRRSPRVLLPKLLGGGAGPGRHADRRTPGLPTGAVHGCHRVRDRDGSRSCAAPSTTSRSTGSSQYPQAFGQPYREADTVFFTGGTNTGCGQASSQMGPFYCPADELVYFDLDFLTQLQQQFGAVGDLAAQYIVAHEYGHHVQNVLGISGQVSRAQQQDPGQANALLGRPRAAGRLLRRRLGASRPTSAACSSRARSARRSTRRRPSATTASSSRPACSVDPDSFTHGTSEQRVQWFRRGYDTGDPNQCDTFAEL